MKDFSCPGLTRAFLFGLLSAVTEMERAMCLAGEALLGRRETGTGTPVRLRSTLPEPALWNEELLRMLFMLEQREGALEAQHRQRSEAHPALHGKQTTCSAPSCPLRTLAHRAATLYKWDLPPCFPHAR